jgi:hypothetical protein
MAAPLLRPGQTHVAFPRFKKALVRALLEGNHDDLASLINPAAKTYGPKAER